jgi:hypothetical protein
MDRHRHKYAGGGGAESSGNQKTRDYLLLWDSIGIVNASRHTVSHFSAMKVRPKKFSFARLG